MRQNFMLCHNPLTTKTFTSESSMILNGMQIIHSFHIPVAVVSTVAAQSFVLAVALVLVAPKHDVLPVLVTVISPWKCVCVDITSSKTRC